MIDGVLEGHSVERRRGDARLDFGNEQIKHFGSNPAGFAHALKVLGAVGGDRKGGAARDLDGFAVEAKVGSQVGNQIRTLLGSVSFGPPYERYASHARL